jgi:putative transposase
MNFMRDSLSDERRVHMFNVIDDYNREALAVKPGLSFPASRDTLVLYQLEEEIGLPAVIRVDNGPEFISKEFIA